MLSQAKNIMPKLSAKQAERQPKTEPPKIRIVNRKARHNYFIVDRFEAGIELLGTEVKSMRDGLVDLSAGFAAIENGQVFLRDVHIKPYEFGHQFNHEPRRPRKLLLHKHEIKRLFGSLTQKGMTMIPLSMYLNKRGFIKVELGLCRGRQAPDKRERLRKEAADRETSRAIAAHTRR
jgi:SsrA-binding protein